MPGPWTGHSQPPDWQTARGEGVDCSSCGVEGPGVGGLTPGQFGRARLSPETTNHHGEHVLLRQGLQPANQFLEHVCSDHHGLYVLRRQGLQPTTQFLRLPHRNTGTDQLQLATQAIHHFGKMAQTSSTYIENTTYRCGSAPSHPVHWDQHSRSSSSC